MKDELKNQLLELLNIQIAEKKVSQNQAADLIGISAGNLSFVRNKENWDKVGDDTWRKIMIWVNYDPTEWYIMETANRQMIQNLCSDSQENCRTMGIQGYTGAGKTVGLRWYANHNEKSYHVICNVTMGPRELLGAILKAMGEEVEGTATVKLTAVVDGLLKKKNQILMLDSVHKLRESCFEIIQQLTESLEYQCGIVLCGTDLLKKIIDKGAAKNKRGFRELRRRIEYWLTLAPVSRKVILEVANNFGIMEKPALAWMVQTINDYGTLRALMLGYKRADKEGRSQIDVLQNITLGTSQTNGND